MFEPEEEPQYLCPTCRIRYYTRKDLKPTHEQREGRERSAERDEFLPTKKVIENYGKVQVEGNIPVERRSNPYKVLFLFGANSERQSLLDRPIRPTPQKYEPSTAYKSARQDAIDAWYTFVKRIFLLTEVMRQASLKYPYLEAWEELFRDFGLGLQVLNKEMRSAVDDRYEKTWFQWLHIIKCAEEVSTEAASKKFYGMRPEGRKSFLTPRHIKEKRKDVVKFAGEILARLPKFFYSISVIDCVILTTPELKQEYERLSKEYDENKESSKKIRGDWQEEDGKEKDNNQRQHYTYRYYKIRHYDRELYRKRKLECQNGTRKSIGEVRIECRVKESELPPEVLSYVKSKSSLS